jgi:hypothetical protein
MIYLETLDQYFHFTISLLHSQKVGVRPVVTELTAKNSECKSAFCKLLRSMASTGHSICRPVTRKRDELRAAGQLCSSATQRHLTSFLKEEVTLTRPTGLYKNVS